MASELGEVKRGETVIWIYYVWTKSVFTKMKKKYWFPLGNHFEKFKTLCPYFLLRLIVLISLTRKLPWFDDLSAISSSSFHSDRIKQHFFSGPWLLASSSCNLSVKWKHHCVASVLKSYFFLHIVPGCLVSQHVSYCVTLLPTLVHCYKFFTISRKPPVYSSCYCVLASCRSILSC